MYVKKKIKEDGGLSGENKVLQKINIAELAKPGVPNGTHQHMIPPRGGSSKGSSVDGVEESLEYEDIQTETKLKDCFGGGGDEERGGWHEICEGWGGGMNPSGEEEEEC